MLTAMERWGNSSALGVVGKLTDVSLWLSNQHKHGLKLASICFFSRKKGSNDMWRGAVISEKVEGAKFTNL